MKVVKLSHPNYEYDVHSLVKAFYAEDQVTVITPETKPEKLAELEPQVSLEIELAETGAKIRVGEEDFLWDAEMETIADGYKKQGDRAETPMGKPYRHPSHEDRLRYAG